MAEFRLALGAHVDVVTPEELKDSLAGLQGSLMNAMPKSAEKPIRRTTSGSFSGSLASGNTTVLQFGVGRPPMGRTWALTRLTLVGNDDHSSAANLVAALYAGDPATPMLGDVVIPNLAIPYWSGFNNRTIWVDDSQEMFLVLTATGAVTNQNVVANVSVSEFWNQTIDQQYA